MKSTSLVVKANRLVQASYKLELVEQRVMEMAIAWSRLHVEQLTVETWIELSVAEYVDLYKSDPKSAYRQLRQAAKNLRLRTLVIEGIDLQTGKPSTLETGWVNSILYVPDAGLIRIQFSAAIVPCISQLEEQFTSFKINSIIGLSSAYAIRLYELLKQYEKIKKRSFELQELREYLEATDVAYDRMDNLKSRVIDKAVEQINAHSDLNISYLPQRRGRFIVGFDFCIDPKERQKALLASPPANAKTPILPVAALSIAEKAMLRDLAAKTGRSEADLLTEARKQNVDLFLALDSMIKQ